jgi:hypothetical protein
MPSVDADQVRAGLIELTEARQRFLDQIALPTSTDQN